MQPPGALPNPRLRSVVLLALGVGGLAACITIVYLAMRAVMDIGGACADGGPYVSANPCPDGVPAAMVLAIFGLFLFGGLAMAGAAGTGGYGWVPVIAWTGLFASLGWNFIDYGLLNPPEGQGIAWGYLVPGVLFQVMAWVPVVVLVAGLRASRRWQQGGIDAGVDRFALTHPGPGMGPTPPQVPASHRIEVAGAGRQEELRAIDGAMGALVLQASAHAPAPPSKAQPAPGPRDRAAVLAHIERLGEMRDRGQLSADEFEALKEQAMRLLEGNE